MVTNSTLSGNATAVGGRGDEGLGDGIGGGIDNSGKLTVTASIFANSEGGNLFLSDGNTFVSMGHNLFSDTPAIPLDPSDLTNAERIATGSAEA